MIFNGLEKNGAEIAASTAREFQVEHHFSAANALHSEQLKAMVEEGLARFKHIGSFARLDRPSPLGCLACRRADQQLRHSACVTDRELPGGEMVGHSAYQSLVGVRSHQGADETDEGAAIRPHHQRRLGSRTLRQRVQIGLRRGETRRGRTDESHRTRRCTVQYQLQRHLPWLRSHAIGRGSNPRSSEISWYFRYEIERELMLVHENIRLESEVISRVMLQKHAVKEFVPLELLGKLALLLADDLSSTW